MKNEFKLKKGETLNITKDSKIELRILGEDGERIDPSQVTMYIKNGRLYIVPNMINLSETEYYDAREDCLKRKQ